MTRFKPPCPTRGLSPEQAASYWFVRQDHGDMTSAEQQALSSWLQQDQAHAAAFEKAQSSWDAFNPGNSSLAGADPRLDALRQSVLAAKPEPWRPGWYALAASILVVLMIGGGAWFSQSFMPKEAPATLATHEIGIPDYTTAKGERIRITLDDGTAVDLNTDSELDVAYQDQRRFVRLLKGQAYFDVTKQADRPFVVEASGRQISVLGTAFDVRLDAGRFQVLLVSGRVAVQKPPARKAANAKPEQIILQPGQELIAKLGVPEQVQQVDIRQRLRWREGYVEFQDELLANAVTEFNRYTTIPITIYDQRITNLRLSGVFRTDRTDHFVEVITRLLPVKAERRENGAILLVSDAGQ